MPKVQFYPNEEPMELHFWITNNEIEVYWNWYCEQNEDKKPWAELTNTQRLEITNVCLDVLAMQTGELVERELSQYLDDDPSYNIEEEEEDEEDEEDKENGND